MCLSSALGRFPELDEFYYSKSYQLFFNPSISSVKYKYPAGYFRIYDKSAYLRFLGDFGREWSLEPSETGKEYSPDRSALPGICSKNGRSNDDPEVSGAKRCFY